MPIPEPKPGEKKDSFISGCMSELKGEFPDVPQRYAVCINKWEEKFKTIVSTLKDKTSKRIN
jgi:hypothetical protein